MVIREFEPCGGCGKPVINKWGRCLPCRQVEKKCRCGEIYKGTLNSDECSKCRGRRRDRRNYEKSRGSSGPDLGE